MSTRQVEDGEIVRNERVSSQYWLMTLRTPRIAAGARPGQFVQIRPFPKADAHVFATDPLLPRPFALYGCEADTIDILYIVVGCGTEMLRAARPGGRMSVLGPLGEGFSRRADARMHVAIGGGTGLAPVRYHLADEAFAGTARHLVMGAREAAMHPGRAVLALEGTEIHLATDDGSRPAADPGAAVFHGNAVDLAARVLDGRGAEGAAVQVYAAGPVPMMRAAWAMCERRGLPCEVSLEALMACGVGVCRSCVVDVREPDPHTGLHRRAMCLQGPVFDAAELDWATVIRAYR